MATYLANSKKIDFLCADRTFCSLSEVAKYSFGHISKVLFHVLTDWNVDLSLNYFSSSAYKVLVYDSRDEIIHILSSLFYGSLKQMTLKKSNFANKKLSQTNSFEKYPKYKWIKPFLCLFFPFIKKFNEIKHFLKEDKAFNDYFHNNFFTENQMKNAAHLLRRMLELSCELEQYQKNKTTKQKKNEFLNLESPNPHSYDSFSGIPNEPISMPEFRQKTDSLVINVPTFNLDENLGKDYTGLLQDGDKNNEDFLNFAHEVRYILRVFIKTNVFLRRFPRFFKNWRLVE